MRSRLQTALFTAAILALMTGCSGDSEKKSYQEALKSGDIKVMKEFVNKDPKGQYAMEMGKKIEKLEYSQCETIFDIGKFAEENPASEYLNEDRAVEALKALEEVNRVLDEKAKDEILVKVANTPPLDVKPGETATIETPFGKMKVKFFTDVAPNHAANFKRLASAGYYNGSKFHRIIPGFVIQGGDINSRDADRNNDGSGGPGYTVDAEFNTVPHTMGILSMARTPDPNSAGSQFFICAAAVPQLDNQYTVFGEVVEGLEVIERIVNQPRDRRDNPKTAIPMYVYMN